MPPVTNWATLKSGIYYSATLRGSELAGMDVGRVCKLISGRVIGISHDLECNSAMYICKHLRQTHTPHHSQNPVCTQRRGTIYFISITLLLILAVFDI